MAIGANWAEIWADVWGPVWSQDAPEPETAPTQTPAGKSRRRRYFVEIDGQQFLVNSQAEAQSLLDHAKALAERAAEKAAERVEAKRKPEKKVAPVKLDPPKIEASPELNLDLTDIRNQLQRVYQDAALALEMRMLLQRQAEQEARDEEEALFLLM